MPQYNRELFDRAVEVVLAHEGGYTHHPDDPGGETNYGICARYNPGVDIKNLTRAEAIEIYWTNYWQIPITIHRRGYEVLPAEVAIKTFDLAVNLGRETAFRILQRALRAGHIVVDDDGILGRKTATAVEQFVRTIGEHSLLCAIRSEAAGIYRMRVAANPRLRAFIGGWLNRAYF